MKTRTKRWIAVLCCMALFVTGLYITEPQKAEATNANGKMHITATEGGFKAKSAGGNGFINMAYTGVPEDYNNSGADFLTDAFVADYITFGGGMTAADLLEGKDKFYVANDTTLQFNWGNRETAFTSGWSFTIAKGALLPYRTVSGTSYMALDKEYTFTFKDGNTSYMNIMKITSVDTTTFSMPTGQVHGTGTSESYETPFYITVAGIGDDVTTKYTPLQTDAQYADYIDFNGTAFSDLESKGVKIRTIFNSTIQCIQVNAWGELRNDFKVGYQVVFHEGMPIYYTTSEGAWKACLDATYVYEGMYSDASHDIVFSGTKIDETASVSLQTRTNYSTGTYTYVNVGFSATENVVAPSSYIGEDFLADYLSGCYIDLSGCSVDLHANAVTFKYIPTANTIQLAFGAAAKDLLQVGDTIVLKKSMPIIYNTKSGNAAACVVLDNEYTFRVVSNLGGDLVMTWEITGNYSLSGKVSNRASELSSHYYNFYLGDDAVWSDSNAKFQGTFTNNDELLENYFTSTTATTEEMKAEGWSLKRYNVDAFIGLRFYCPVDYWDFETGDYVIFKKGLPVSYTTTSNKTKTTYLDRDYGFVYDADTEKFTYDATLGNEGEGAYVNYTISKLGANSGYDTANGVWKLYLVSDVEGNVPGTENVTTFGALYEIDGVACEGTYTRASDADGLLLTIPTDRLPADADDVFVTVKAGEQESGEDCAGINIRGDFTIYVYQASLGVYAGDVTREADASSYVISEADTVEIDGQSYEKGSEYTESGDHVLTYVADECTYAKRLVIYRIGDVNDDETINVKDLVVMKKKLANERGLSRAGALSMDMNIDDEMTSDDVALIRQYLITDEGVLPLAPNENIDVAKASDAAEELITDYKVNDAQSIKTGKDIYHRDVTTLKWLSFENTEEYTLLVSTSADMSNAITYTTTTTNLKLINLLANTDYYWTVTANGKTSEIQHFHTADTIRTITVDGVSNTRDGGGWTTVDGKKVKQGMFYRGGRLESITETGKAVMLEQLGIQTDLDLRDSAETSGGSSPISCEQYLNYSGPCYWNGTKGINNEAYHEALANEIKAFANEENYPIYVHCSLGRDRTGTICFFINALLGVSEEDLFLDYEFSVLSVTGNQDNATVAGLTYQFNYMLENVQSYDEDGTIAEAAEAFLVTELSEYGITSETINTIRQLLLES